MFPDPKSPEAIPGFSRYLLLISLTSFPTKTIMQATKNTVKRSADNPIPISMFNKLILTPIKELITPTTIA